MKIIIEGTTEELRNVIHFGIPKEVFFDDGKKFVKFESRRRNCVVTRLEPEMRKAVDDMLLNGCSYSHISQKLKSLGISISKQAISNYHRNYYQPPMTKDELMPFACGERSYKGHRHTKGELDFGLDYISRDNDLIKAQVESYHNFKNLKETIGEKISDFLPETEAQPTNPVIRLEMIAKQASNQTIKAKVYYNGIKIKGAFHTFGSPEDMWRYVGETVKIIDDYVFDCNNRYIGCIN